MKARLFMFMALVLGLVSCQNDPDEMNVSLGGEQEVMLTVSLPEATRADSADGALDNNVLEDYDLRYILEVYYGEKCNRFVQTSTSTSAVFPVRLAPGRDYTFVVWADFVTKGADAEQDIDLFYETSAGLKAIQIIDAKWAPMVEARDAYVGSKPITDFQTSSNLEMTLTRPFAKVRVVSTDIEQLRGVGIVPTTAQATYSQNMYRKFNAATGVASDASPKTHTFAYADVDSYEENTDSKLTIFSDYIFVPAEGVAKFTLEVWDGEATPRSIKQNNFNTDIFVEKNKVTSIVGDVLTTGGNVKVTIDGELGEKETITVIDNAQSLQDAINNAPDGEETIIELGGDIDLNDLFGISTLSTRAGEPVYYALVVPEGKVVNLDLNGKTLSLTKNQTGRYALIENNGNLSIYNSDETNGVISYCDNATLTADVGYASNTIQNNGTLTINEGVTLLNTSNESVATYGYPHVIDTNGELIINGGTLTNAANYSTIRIWTSNTDPEKCKVTINGGTFNGCIDFQSHNNNYPTIPHYGTLTVTGGTFNPDTYTKSAIRVLRFGVNADDMYAKISGGRFSGKVAVRNYSSSNEIPNIFDICGGTFTTDAKAGTDEAFINDDYAWVETENGLWTVERKADVAKIGEVGYTSLQKAVAEAQNGDTVLFIADIEQEDGVIITDKNITIDLNNKTFTVSNGASTNNRNFKVNGSSVVTIKNGNMVAEGDYSSGAYGTVRTENTANVTLEGVKLYNYRGNGLNVKALSGTTVTINDTEIYSEYGGGVEAAGGTVELNNVTIDQNGVYSGAAWNSVAIGVNGNGKVTVNSGNYSASAISTDANAAQGTWVAYVMSSGGTLDIKGGTFNGVVAETAAAANACGLICADRAAVVEIHGGTFNSNGAILDMRNNAGTLPNPEATLFGGTFSADPRVSGLYSSNLITVADGYMVVVENGIWTVVQYTPFSELVEKVKAANGTYVGQGETYTIMPTSGDAREQGVAATVPNRLQKYPTPEVYYAQYQLFAELDDVNISNVEIEFIPAAITVKDAWNTAGATTTKDNVNGEVQFLNSGKVTLTDCVFNTVSVSPINAPELAVSGCEFNELKAYAIKDVKAGVVNISNNEFNNCNGGFWFNAAPENVVANGNIFSVGRRGAIQFSANGDYTNTVIDITGNTVVGALLWQLNETLPYQAYKTIIENNTYTTACVDGSFIPEPDVAKIGETYYKTFAAAVAAAKAGDTIVIMPNTTIDLTKDHIKGGIIIEGGENVSMSLLNADSYISIKCDATFKNIKFLIKDGLYYYRGIDNGGYSHTYIDCDFTGIATNFGNNTYTNCTFTSNVKGQYAAWVYSGTADYTNCTFNGVDRAVKVYTEANGTATVVYTDCKFNAQEVNKTAVEIDSSLANVNYNVTITNATISNMGDAENWGTKYFNIEGTGAVVNHDGQIWDPKNK